MTDLATLAERVERTEEPSRELDVKISLAVGRESEVECLDKNDPAKRRWVPWKFHPHSPSAPSPCYTSSIDAALTLVEGDHYIGIEKINPGHWQAFIREGNINCSIHRAMANSAALALCAVALRARSKP